MKLELLIFVQINFQTLILKLKKFNLKFDGTNSEIIKQKVRKLSEVQNLTINLGKLFEKLSKFKMIVFKQKMIKE